MSIPQGGASIVHNWNFTIGSKETNVLCDLGKGFGDLERRWRQPQQGSTNVDDFRSNMGNVNARGETDRSLTPDVRMEGSDSHEGTNAGFGRMAKSQHDSVWVDNFVRPRPAARGHQRH